MKLQLPPRLDGSRDTIVADNRRIIVIGANGAGKTRFTERFISELDSPVFRLSALKALYRCDAPDNLPGSIDSRYVEATSQSSFIRSDNATQFERLTTLMLYDEVLNLIAHKVTNSDGKPVPLPESHLDRVIKAWQEVFPENKVLREGGKLLFSRNNDSTEAYSSLKLSDGEKAVLYYFGALQYAPGKAVVFVDSPGMFLHPSITGFIWDKVESMRPDCTFVYTTHDVEFLSARRDNAIVWVRG